MSGGLNCRCAWTRMAAWAFANGLKARTGRGDHQRRRTSITSGFLRTACPACPLWRPTKG